MSQPWFKLGLKGQTLKTVESNYILFPLLLHLLNRERGRCRGNGETSKRLVEAGLDRQMFPAQYFGHPQALPLVPDFCDTVSDVTSSKKLSPILLCSGAHKVPARPFITIRLLM